MTRGVRISEIALREALRLRVEDRKSLREIAAATGLSKATLSPLLKAYPLTWTEKQAKVIASRATPSVPRKSRGEVSKWWKVAREVGLTPQRAARIAEAAVLFRLVLQGYSPFVSHFDWTKSDIIAESDRESHQLLRLQVRVARRSDGDHGLPFVSLRCADGRQGLKRYGPDAFDFLIGYDLYSDTAYVFSAAEVAHLGATVTVSPDFAERWGKLPAP